MLAKHPDPTVAHVLETWAPRMIVQGIDYNDLMTTGARIRVWDDWGKMRVRELFSCLSHIVVMQTLFPRGYPGAKGLCKDLLTNELCLSFSTKADRKLS